VFPLFRTNPPFHFALCSLPFSLVVVVVVGGGAFPEKSISPPKQKLTAKKVVLSASAAMIQQQHQLTWNAFSSTTLAGAADKTR
jgi:hypothetical protein